MIRLAMTNAAGGRQAIDRMARPVFIARSMTWRHGQLGSVIRFMVESGTRYNGQNEYGNCPEVGSAG